MAHTWSERFTDEQVKRKIEALQAEIFDHDELEAAAASSFSHQQWQWLRENRERKRQDEVAKLKRLIRRVLAGDSGDEFAAELRRAAGD